MTTANPLKITKIEVRNFRLLNDVTIDLEEGTTALVGRNNSGKTTLADIFELFFTSGTRRLSAADFSATCYNQFLEACQNHDAGLGDNSGPPLPAITLVITISYSKDMPQYGALAPAIVDFDPECTEAIIQLEYALQGDRRSELFEGVQIDSESDYNTQLAEVMKVVSSKLPALYGRTIRAIDPHDETNTRELTLDQLRELIVVDFLKAQRGLNDEKERPRDLIGKVFQELYDAAARTDVGSPHKAIVKEITEAVADIEENLGRNVGKMMEGLVPALEQFGYPGFNDPGPKAITTLNIDKVLTNHTTIHYDGAAGIPLPESYNGLGSRNLILILLKLLGFYREFSARGDVPGIHLVFIEEPEAHLHPQMQEVFIEQLHKLSAIFPSMDKIKTPWEPQFIISTHSSHIANKASFASIRYFKVSTTPQNGYPFTEICDLGREETLNEEFLHKYLTLTRSDLFFADKAILVEGISERLIVPAAINELKLHLANQYVTIVEVGGAYAHIFFPLLDFLGIPSLIITDIDSIGPVTDTKRDAATEVHNGTTTSNATIKAWRGKKGSLKPTDLIKWATSERLITGNRYLAFQVPERGQEACGRTFEDAFILANPDIWPQDPKLDSKDLEKDARNTAKKFRKSDFAFEYAISKRDWKLPRYIMCGLYWLEHYYDPTVAWPATNSSIEAGDGAEMEGVV